MKKSILIITICLLAGVTFGQSAPPVTKPDTLKWSVRFESTAVADRVLQMLDTAKVTINNSDIPAKDRVKVVGYLVAIINELMIQFNKQNKPIEPDKAKASTVELKEEVKTTATVKAKNKP